MTAAPSHITERERPAARVERPRLRIAYFTTMYPRVSHTFIRRELLELERFGHHVVRSAVRRSDAPTPDAQDQAEETRTTQILSQPKARLLLAAVRAAITQPARFCRALKSTLIMAKRSDRGLFKHLAYLVEAAFLREFARREKIQHVHVHFGTNAAAVALLAHQMGGPTYSITIHGPDEFDAPIGLSLADKVAGASFIAAISSYAAAQVRRWIPLDQWGKVHIVRCTVGEQFLGAATPLDPNSKTLLCIGRFNAQKGHLQLIEAFARVIAEGLDAKLVLAGDGELRREIESQIAHHGLERHVEITGWIPESEVRRRIRECRAVVMASFAEGLPMVLMEAFALGRVAVATSVAGIPELVRPGQNGWLVPAGDSESLADAMKEVLAAAPATLNAMAMAGRDLVLERHNTPTEAAKLEELVYSVTRP